MIVLPMSARYHFLIETYRTERIKTLGVWSQIPDAQMRYRPEPRARTPHEHMVHQCVSEDTWMKNMLEITASRPALPGDETRQAFLEHYAAVSADRLAQLESKPDDWFEAETRFFLKEVDAQITFERDAGGAVTGLVLHQNGQNAPGKRLP